MINGRQRLFASMVDRELSSTLTIRRISTGEEVNKKKRKWTSSVRLTHSIKHVDDGMYRITLVCGTLAVDVTAQFSRHACTVKSDLRDLGRFRRIFSRLGFRPKCIYYVG